MRINSGIAKGIELKMPENAQCRPTSDKLKQAVFNSIGNGIVGAAVADIFAGSGSLGLEALSRGAQAAVLIENNGQAVNAIRENIEKTKLPAELIQADALQIHIDRNFDFCFADPPYNLNIFPKLLEKFRAKAYIFEFAVWAELEKQLPNAKPGKIKNISIKLSGVDYLLEKIFKFGIKKAVILSKML
jgi:16S rRNA (guanine(966)-N(2))-methyltransferase RsmD